MEQIVALLGGVLIAGIVFKLVAALVVGALARFLLPGKDQVGWGITLLVGFIGGWVYDLVGGIAGFVKPGENGGLFGAIVGAMGLLAAYRLWKGAQARSGAGQPPRA
jgi:uncharacterized membrane protein YeaQ/YmgE (transglycosylase-associated protein family)